MKNLTCFTLVFMLATAISRAKAEDLNNVLAFTYENNPSILSARTYLKSLDEQVALALSGYRPGIAASGSAAAIETSGDNSNQYDVGVSAQQNFFQGFNTIASTKLAEHQVKAGRYQLLSVEQQVLTSAAAAYMAVIRDEAILNLQIKNEQVLQKELETNRNRFAVGEITRTDLSQSEASLSLAKANRIQAEGTLQTSRAAYLAIIGKMPESLVAPQPLDMLMPASLDEAKEIALKSNPEIIYSKFSQRALNDNIMVQRSGLLPSLDGTASAVHSWNHGRDIYGVRGTSDGETLTARATLTIPLYDAGADRARVRNAKQLANQGKIDIEKISRDIIQSLTSNWETLKASKAQIVSIQAQIKASELALQGVKQEFEVGARTVLDVLDAEQALLDARVSLVRSMYEETVMSFMVLSDLGRMTPTYLTLNTKQYDPKENYKNTKSKWLSTTIE